MNYDDAIAARQDTEVLLLELLDHIGCTTGDLAQLTEVLRTADLAGGFATVTVTPYGIKREHPLIKSYTVILGGEHGPQEID